MDLKQQIQAILLQKATKLPKLKASKTWLKVYNEIVKYLKQFSEEVFLDQQEDDSNDDFLSSLAELDLEIADSVKQRFNSDIINAVESMTMTDEEVKSKLEKITDALDVALEKCGIVGNKWRPYGSYENGLSCKDSDIDLYYENIRHGSTTKPQKIQRRIFACLKKQPDSFTEVVSIKNARVPIIKLKHNGTGKECDISFCEIGVQNSMLTKFFITLYPNVKYLTLYLKLILKKCDLYGTNRMTTHIIFWLVAFFLQRKGLLPSVREVRKEYDECEATELFDNWNCSLKDDFTNPCDRKSECLLSLLLGFAKFYRDFDFTKFVISPYLAHVIPIEEFEKWRIPAEILPSKFQKFKGDGTNTFFRHLINLQDPLILSSNAAKSVGIKPVNIFKLVCNALLLLFKNKASSLLNNSLIENFSNKPPELRMLPRDLKQCTSIKFNLKGLTMQEVNSERVFQAVHKVMGVALSFDLKRKTQEEIFQITRKKRNTIRYGMTVPIIYMTYSSTTKTWSNANVRKLLLYPNSVQNRDAGLNRSVNVYLICEINPPNKEVRILIQSEMYLLRFLHKYGRLMFDQAISV